MVRALLSLVGAVASALSPRRAQIYEVVGAGAVVVGLVGLFGVFVGFVAVGVALLGKSLEHDLGAGSAKATRSS